MIKQISYINIVLVTINIYDIDDINQVTLLEENDHNIESVKKYSYTTNDIHGGYLFKSNNPVV